MDGFELNKIAGGALAALLTIFGTKTLLDIALKKPEPAKAGFIIPVTAPAAGGAAVAAAGPVKLEIPALLAKASAEAGADAFKKCAACHTPAKGGPNTVGPNLWGVVGRKMGAAPGFAFSDAVKAKGGEWTFENLAAYIHDPKGFIPGNKMAFAGVKDPAELGDVLAYLNTLSDSPKPLPK